MKKLMKFSTKAEYGLKAAINLAIAYPESKPLSTIAGEENVSQKYLERIISSLKKNGIVIAQKGKSGGYTLSSKPSAVTVKRVVEALEGPIAPVKCVTSCCSSRNKCPSSHVWILLAQKIGQTLEAITLESFIKK
jgi:Rrf2 family protein